LSKQKAQSQILIKMKNSLDLVLVLDFEATCNEGPWPEQEIIEFPVHIVVPSHARSAYGHLDGAEFHSYVRPTLHPTLTAFCTSLTGIEQHTVDAAPPFPAVLAQFTAWVAATVPADARWTFCTCGDWDLNTCLPRQMELAFGAHDWRAWPAGPFPRNDAAWPEPEPERSAVVPGAHADNRRNVHWVNCKDLFRAVLPGAGSRLGMPAMLDALKLPLIGRHHSGIDDTRNIAGIVRALLQRAEADPARLVKRITARNRNRNNRRQGKGKGRGRIQS
jgi:ERI1 exoribonuclease 3